MSMIRLRLTEPAGMYRQQPVEEKKEVGVYGYGI